MTNISKNHKHGVPAVTRGVALRTRSAEKEETVTPTATLRASLRGLLIFIFSGAILLTASTALALSTEDPASLVFPLSMASLLPSAFLGGLTASRRIKGAPLLCGVISGGVITLFSILLSIVLPLPSTAPSFPLSASLHAATLLFSILGAMAGCAASPKKHPHRPTSLNCAKHTITKL